MEFSKDSMMRDRLTEPVRESGARAAALDGFSRNRDPTRSPTTMSFLTHNDPTHSEYDVRNRLEGVTTMRLVRGTVSVSGAPTVVDGCRFDALIREAESEE